MFYLIIAGGREFSNYPVLRNAVDYYIQKHGLTEVTIVSGKARGADTLGETYAAERGLPVWEFPADWDGLGKKAGHVRNRQMGDVANGLVAFDTGGKGTKGMVAYAQEKGLNILVVDCTTQKGS